MHKKNPFAADYDFDNLIKHNEALAKYVFPNKQGTKTIKFGDQRAVKALNKALLKTQFDVHWDIPKGFPCPPIPGRLDYLLNIADLLPEKEIKMLDIGTGANMIYPILATRHFGWHCTASELNPDSIKHAAQIISNNPSLSSVELRVQSDPKLILENIIEPDDKFDVMVCNPPHFKSLEDAQKHNQRKVRNLSSKKREKLNFAGRSNELWTPGGEAAFIQTLAEESVQFMDQVGWFTSLISRNDSVRGITEMIDAIPRTEVKVVEMTQGIKASRFVAWRFKETE